LRILECNSEGSVERHGSQQEANPAGDGLPRMTPGKLIDARGEKPEGREAQHRRGYTLSPECDRGGNEHRKAGNDEERACRGARRARLRREKNEAEGCPRSAQHAHPCSDSCVPSEVSENRSKDLERRDECEQDQADELCLTGA